MSSLTMSACSVIRLILKRHATLFKPSIPRVILKTSIWSPRTRLVSEVVLYPRFSSSLHPQGFWCHQAWWMPPRRAQTVEGERRHGSVTKILSEQEPLSGHASVHRRQPPIMSFPVIITQRMRSVPSPHPLPPPQMGTTETVTTRATVSRKRSVAKPTQRQVQRKPWWTLRRRKDPRNLHLIHRH